VHAAREHSPAANRPGTCRHRRCRARPRPRPSRSDRWGRPPSASLVMSTSASSMNWWCIDGSRRLRISSGGMREVDTSRYTPPWGVPRPGLDLGVDGPGHLVAGQQLRRRRAVRCPGRCSQLVGLLLGGGVLPLEHVGHVLEHEALAVGVASARRRRRGRDSVTSRPRTEGGQTMPVGWNCRNSMLISVAPARRARAWPSPVYSQEFDVTLSSSCRPRRWRARSPGRRTRTNRPVAAEVAEGSPRSRPSVE
jgi:hypothetical protein